MATLQEVTQLIKDGKLAEARRAIGEILKADQANATAWALASRVTDDKAQKIQALERAITSANLSPSPDNQKAADWARKELQKLRGARSDPLSEVDGSKSRRQGWLMGCSILAIVLLIAIGIGGYFLRLAVGDSSAILACSVIRLRSASECNTWLADLKANHKAEYDHCVNSQLIPQIDPMTSCLMTSDLLPEIADPPPSIAAVPSIPAATDSPTLEPSKTLVPSVTPTTTPESIVLTNEHIIAALLTLDELRAGYIEDTKPEPITQDTYTVDNPAFSAYLASHPANAFRVGFYQNTEDGAYVLSRVWVFPDAVTAAQFLKDYPVLITIDGRAPEELSFKSYGEESSAFFSPLTQDSYDYDDYIVSIRIRNLVAQVIVQWSRGFGKIDEVEEYARKQETKLDQAARR